MDGDMELRLVQMYELIESLGAEVEALRAATFAIAAQLDPDALDLAFQAASTIASAHLQGSRKPDRYIEQVDERLRAMHASLRLASGAPPPAP